MLDILVLTDASAAESINASPGFQFVAHSEGATKTDESQVRDRLQHSVPSSMGANEWAQHPATCVYARVDGRMYLSRGHSTGATLGGRPGNQLTVTVMTSDPYDILPLRPAQLFSSPAWDFARPTAHDRPGWETPVQISEDFDTPALHALVVDDPWAVGALPRMLTMLEQTQAERRTRLFVRHPDQATVMRWVSLLSRFLDADSALGLEFRVFSDDPFRSNTHIVGVHPLLSPDVTAASAGASGVNVIDLERRELSPIVASESATRYARWFVAGDPYEALEAIEVGRRWTRVMDADTAAAAAELATMPSTRGDVDRDALLTSLTAIIALATAGELDELEAYGDELADLAASCPPGHASDLRAIDAALWAAASAGDREIAQSLALAGLEWAAAQPALLDEWAATARPAAPLEWHSEDARAHAAGLLATALNAASGASLATAFTFAASLNTGIAADAIPAPIDELVDRWITDPRLSESSRGWVLGSELVRRLTDTLDTRLAAGDQSAVSALLAGSWDWVAPAPWAIDVQNPLTRWLAVRELRGADAQRRGEVLDTVQASLPNSAWRVLLVTPEGLNPDEVTRWIRAHRALDPGLANEIERALHEIDRHPAWQRMGGAKVLHEVGKLGAAIPVPLMADVDAQKQIITLFTQGERDKDRPSNAALRTLGTQFAGRLNDLYGDWITKSVMQSEDTRAAVALAEGPGRARVIATTQSSLEKALRRGSRSAMLTAVRLLDPALGPWRDAAEAALNAVWDDKKTEEIRDQLLASVDRRLSDAEHGWLEAYLATQSKGRITRGVLRGARSVFGSKDNGR